MAIINSSNVLQIGFVVRDIEATKKKFEAFFGVTPTPTNASGGNPDIIPIYKGEPSPTAGAKMSFVKVGDNFNIELIEPIGENNTWREFLDEHGEGVHHIGLVIQDMDQNIKNCEENGIECVQRSTFKNGKGRYAYMDTTKDLKVIVELLEHFK